jgi:hypothetical protein
MAGGRRHPVPLHCPNPGALPANSLYRMVVTRRYSARPAARRRTLPDTSWAPPKITKAHGPLASAAFTWASWLASSLPGSIVTLPSGLMGFALASRSSSSRGNHLDFAGDHQLARGAVLQQLPAVQRLERMFREADRLGIPVPPMQLPPTPMKS